MAAKSIQDILSASMDIWIGIGIRIGIGIGIVMDEQWMSDEQTVEAVGQKGIINMWMGCGEEQRWASSGSGTDIVTLGKRGDDKSPVRTKHRRCRNEGGMMADCADCGDYSDCCDCSIDVTAVTVAVRPACFSAKNFHPRTSEFKNPANAWYFSAGLSIFPPLVIR